MSHYKREVIIPTEMRNYLEEGLELQFAEHINRGLHIKIFDLDGRVISDEYASPYLGSHSAEEIYAKESKIFWYRKSQQMWPKCIQDYLLSADPSAHWGNELRSEKEFFEITEVEWIRCPPWNKDMDKVKGAENYAWHQGSKDDYFYKFFNVEKFSGFEVQIQVIW